MNPKYQSEIERLSREISQQSRDLAILGNEYERKRKEIQIKLSGSAVQLATLMSIASKAALEPITK